MTSRPAPLAPGVPQRIADGIGALRLLVVVAIALDAASTFWELRLSETSWSAVAVTSAQLVLTIAAAAAVMWLRPRLAVTSCALVLLLAVTVGPTSEELWLLVVVAVTVGSRAPARVVLVVAAAELGYAVSFGWRVQQRSQGWGWQATAIATVLCGSGFVAGLVARRCLTVLERRRLRLAELEQENARIRATERLRLADDLQTVVTGGLAAIRRRLGLLADHPDDVVLLRGGLTEIERESRSVLAELRALLEILRRDPATTTAEHDLVPPRRPRRWVDVLTARQVRLAAVTAFALLAGRAGLEAPGWRLTPSSTVEALGWLACAVAVLRPRIGALVATAALVVSVGTGTPSGWSALPTAVLFFLGALHAGVRRLWLVLAALLAYGAVLVATASDWPLALNDASYAAALAIVAGLAAGHFLDAGRDSARRRAGLLDDRSSLKAEERVAVARDLHDVVAHQLSLTNLSIMGTSASTDPAKLSLTLHRVSENVRAADRELILLVHDMRGATGDVQTTPLVLPSAGAETFARRLTASGFRPVVEMDRCADDLDATTMRTLGRIMQEATTNIVRYAPAGAVCQYALAVAEDRVQLTVLSPMAGPRRSALSLGWGLRGVAERVELSRGTFDAGPRPGGWVVDVTLPRPTDRGGVRAGQPA